MPLTDFEHELLPRDEQKDAVERAKTYLPDDATLLQLSFTGSRAFGWGTERHDIDVRGFFEKEDWFNKVHAEREHDLTMINVYDRDDPSLIFRRFKMYYDHRYAFYEHPDFRWEDALKPRLDVDMVSNVYPQSMRSEIMELKAEFQIRTALHCYKEYLIALHYARTGEIEPDIVNRVNERDEYQLEGLQACAEWYSEHEVEPDHDMVIEELESLDDQLEDELVDAGVYDPDAEPEQRRS